MDENEDIIKKFNNLKIKGQYFTKNEILKQKVNDFILNNPKEILEPSFGRGDLIEKVYNKNIIFDMYEIDSTIIPLKNIEKYGIIKYKDFIKENITKKYNTIIGNPPFVRTKKGNLYIDFVIKCFELLDDNGELIFIVPSDFFKLTCASVILNNMIKSGTFTHVYHPNNEKMFENAIIDVIVFRYCKDDSLEKKTEYNGKSMYINNSNGLITFSEKLYKNQIIIKDFFDVYVGLVSGKESVYKNKELGNIEVMNKENILEKYIYINSFPSQYEKINDYLNKNKKDLINRKIRKFNDKNWFEWGAPRNIKNMEKYKDTECIYIYNLTRNDTIAFKGKIMYFGGNLIMLKPKNGVVVDLTKIVLYLNSNNFKKNFTYSKRFKIGHKNISDSLIDI